MLSYLYEMESSRAMLQTNQADVGRAGAERVSKMQRQHCHVACTTHRAGEAESNQSLLVRISAQLSGVATPLREVFREGWLRQRLLPKHHPARPGRSQAASAI